LGKGGFAPKKRGNTEIGCLEKRTGTPKGRENGRGSLQQEEMKGALQKKGGGKGLGGSFGNVASAQTKGTARGGKKALFSGGESNSADVKKGFLKEKRCLKKVF